ncbi:MAG: arylformamidase [Alphaproteobacteria bacterium]|jgi:arylformamidase|nr:arylformamidase [Alphaproteobacteria bacterium]
MNKNDRSDVTRRALVVAAAAGTVALAVEPASAQRCPAVPPARVKGPAVWLDMDQQDIDDAYDNDVYAFNAKTIDERRVFNNEIAQSILAKPERVAYGPSEIEKLDIYKTTRANAPVMVFIHGGSWRGGRSSQFTVYAEPFVKAGANFVVLDFTNVRETDGDIFPLVEQCRRAIAWVYRNAASFGGNPNEIYTISRSSGSHLNSCVVITEWEKQGLPRDIVKGAVMGSGMYDLKPVRLSKRSSFVKFTDEMEQQLSALRHLDKIHTPLVLANGTLETPEFQRQARDFAAALTKAGKPVKHIIAKGYNHYEVGETIGHPYAVLGRAAFEMMKLNTA